MRCQLSLRYREKHTLDRGWPALSASSSPEAKVKLLNRLLRSTSTLLARLLSSSTCAVEALLGRSLRLCQLQLKLQGEQQSSRSSQLDICCPEQVQQPDASDASLSCKESLLCAHQVKGLQWLREQGTVHWAHLVQVC